MAVGGQGAQIVSVAAGRIQVNLTQPASDLLTTFGAGAKVYLEKDTTSAFAAPSVVTSTVIVSGTELYEFVDTAGTSSSWYRVRVGDSLGTLYSEYSNGLQASALLSYATVDDLRETMNFGATDHTKDNLLADLLAAASNYITEVTGRSFYRSPQVSGTETRTFNLVNAGRRFLTHALGKPLDIASLSTLEIADSTGGTYTTVAAGSTGYYLSPTNPGTGWPYEDVLLSDIGDFTSFPTAYGAVRITGVFGWSSVPPLIRQATIDLAREWYRQGPGGGGPIGTSILGAPIFQRGNPPSVEQAIAVYRRVSFAVIG